MRKAIFTLAAAAVLLTACQAEKSSVKSSTSEIKIQMTAITEDDSRTSIDETNAVTWGKGEYVKMYYNDGTDKFATSDATSADINAGSLTADFDFTITPAEAASYKLGGMYPASAAAATEGSPIVKAVIPSVQNATATSYDPAAYIMVIRPEEVAAIPSQWQAWFRKAAALNKVTLTGVKDDIVAVEFTSTGKNFSGAAAIDMTSGEITGYSDNESTVKVQYASALPAGNMDIWFTTWESKIASGETLTINAITADGCYSKTITARADGISFTEGCLNKLTVDFSAVEFHKYTFKDWAVEFAKLYDVWMANTNSKGHIIPENYTFSLGAVTYNKAKAYGVACDALNALYAGESIDMDIPAAKAYKWGDNPYYPNGSLSNIFVNLDFLLNFTSRQLSYASSHSNVFANLCAYSNSTTSGTPSVAGKGYSGDCALECHLLMMVRFYKYLLDNNFESNLAAIENQIHVKSGLYKETDFSGNASTFAFEASSAASQTLSLTAIEDWSAETSDGWITVSPASGSGSYAGATSITISVADNSGAAREGNITFTSTKGDASVIKVSQDAKGFISIKDFAMEYVKILDIWQKTTGTINMITGENACAEAYEKYNVDNAHYVPDATTITVGGKVYSTADMMEAGQRSYLLLRGYDGNWTGGTGAASYSSHMLAGSTMSGTAVPGTHGFYFNQEAGNGPYNETSSNGGHLKCGGVEGIVKCDILDNFAMRSTNWGSTHSGAISNMCSYTSNQVPGYTGVFCARRALLTYAAFFKYMLDNELETATDISATQKLFKFDCRNLL